MTWIEVASDAVKIGLGALIGAIAAIVNAKVNYSHKKNEEYSKRRRDSLELIMPEFEETSLALMQLTVDIPDAFKNILEDNKIDTEVFDYQKEKREIKNLNLALVKLESKVILLGFEELASKIDELRVSMLDIVNTKTSTRKLMINKILVTNELKDNITKEFAEAYKNA